MPRLILVLICSLALQACMKRKYADLVVHNAVIHVLDENNTLGEAMAIREGKVIEVGPERQILNKYRWGRSIDAEKRHIYPGFIDSYGHYIKAMMNGFTREQWNRKSFDSAMCTLQQQLLRCGVVEMHEAGIDKIPMEWLMDFNAKEKLYMRCYAILDANEENFVLAKKLGVFRKGNLCVRSFHLAHDDIYSVDQSSLLIWGKRCQDLKYQLVYYPSSMTELDWFWTAVKNAYLTYPDHRWRLVLSKKLSANTYENLKKYAVIPLVLIDGGDKKVTQKGGITDTSHGINPRALMDAFGMFATGTNNPNNPIMPFQFYTQFRATDIELKQNHVPEWKKLSLEELLKTMTVWAAFTSFSERSSGALGEGMEANFFIAKHAITLGKHQDNYSLQTFIRGLKVYDAKEEF
ncbi:MAG: hypothetical protein EB023_13565 [Flavobacteriia bacterium]|nr:hypothetical protein [Flavobacteriia bacterium]